MGCVASFPPPARVLTVDAFDPEDLEEEPVDLSVDLDRYFLAYYEPFVVALDAGASAAGDEAVSMVSFDAVGLRLGLLNVVLDRVRQAIDGRPEGLSADLTAMLLAARVEPGRGTAFPDGSVIETDWAEALSGTDHET